MLEFRRDTMHYQAYLQLFASECPQFVDIFPPGGAALGALVARNQSLLRLDIRWNNIGVSGGRALADGVCCVYARFISK
jgi:hypothetical protein